MNSSVIETKPKLFLHVGAHKTGTTAIQQFCLKNLGAIKNKGIIYPSYNINGAPLNGGHHQLAHSVSRSPKALSKEQAKDIVNELFYEAVGNENSVLISAESIYRNKQKGAAFESQRVNYLVALRKLFEDFDVHVLLVLRRPDDYIRSCYQEMVKIGFKKQPSFYDFTLNNPYEGVMFMKQLACFDLVFDNVSVLSYEDLSNGEGLITNFFAHLGKNISDVKPQRIDLKERVGLPTQIVYLKNIANNYLKNRKHARNFLNELTKDKYKNEISEIFPEENYTFWKSEAHYNTFLNVIKKEMFRLKNRTGIDYLSLNGVNNLAGTPIEECLANDAAVHALLEKVINAI